jgi:hypothetical protein
MSRHRTVSVALATLTLAGAGALLISSLTTAQPTKSQQLFRKALLDDAKTTSAIKRLLRDEGGFVAPEIEFADVTGDERSDAVVLVDTGSAAGLPLPAAVPRQRLGVRRIADPARAALPRGRRPLLPGENRRARVRVERQRRDAAPAQLAGARRPDRHDDAAELS